MSLADSLLLESYSDFHDVWIALRTDGVPGSGTQSDPYDGSTKALTPLSASLAKDSADGSGKTIVATATNHGYALNDVVRITNAGDSSYAGEFAVSTVQSADVFKYVMKSAPAGNSTSASCSKLVYQFDEIMRTTVGTNTAIHIGPGIFETRGSTGDPVPPGWKPQNGQRISGAGIGLTTLKIAGGAVRNKQYFAVATPYSELLADFEASDFTIDCNSEGQPSPHVACAAISIGGGARRVRIRHVRAIRFGSHAPDGYVENFVFFLSATHPYYVQQNGQTSDVIFEDCIAEQPSPNVLWNSTIFHMGGGEWPGGDETTEYHHGCAIRNCFADGRIVYGPVVPMASISYDGVLVTVTTKAPHLLAKPGNVLVQGVTVSQKTDNLFNGLFAIEQIISDTNLTYRLVTSGTPDGTNATLGGGVPSHPVQIDSITPDDSLEICPFLALYAQQVYEPIRTHTLRTLEPHFRTTNNNVTVGGVLAVTFPGQPAVASAAFNGSFAVDEYDPGKPNELVYTLLQDPDFDPKNLVFTGGAFVKIGHQALSADNGIAAVVEGNRVYHVTIGGPYHDSWQSRDLVCRENWYHDIIYGPFQNLGAGSVSPWYDGILLGPPGGSLTHSGSTATATVRDESPAVPRRPHGFSPGDKVLIFGANIALYNGEFDVTAVPDEWKFKYEMKGTPSGDASGARFRGADSHRENLRPLFSLTRDPSNHTLITAVMLLLPDAGSPQSQKHGLEKGDIFWLIKAGYWNGIGTSPYHNIKVKVSAVLSDTEFQFMLPTDPGFDSVYHPAGAFSPGYFGRIWEFGRLSIENNVIELGVRKLNGDYGRSLGVFLYVGGSEPQFTGRQTVIRDNVIRHVNNGSDVNGFSKAFQIYKVENVLLQNNIIRVDGDDAVTQARAIAYAAPDSAIRTSSNWTPAGNLIRAILQDTPYTPAPEMETTVQTDLEDILLASFLGDNL